MEFRKEPGGSSQSTLWTLLASWFRDHHKDGPIIVILTRHKIFFWSWDFYLAQVKIALLTRMSRFPKWRPEVCMSCWTWGEEFSRGFAREHDWFFVIFSPHPWPQGCLLLRWATLRPPLLCGRSCWSRRLPWNIALHWIDLSFSLACDILWFLELINWDDQL